MEPPSEQGQIDRPIEYCDLVMKGGITSGVVYPLAITELSKKYLLRTWGYLCRSCRGGRYSCGRVLEDAPAIKPPTTISRHFRRS